MYDVVIVGGGPAGLSAALVLGRCRRKVVVCDAGRPRNRWAVEMHGYLSRDRIDPAELLRLGRGEIARYGVEFRAVGVVDARANDDGTYSVTLADGALLRTRKLMLATGVRDVLPDIPDIEAYYGRSVHHCPYCDGWEHRDGRLAAYGKGKKAVGLALSLKTWSPHVVACTDAAPIGDDLRERAERNGVPIREERVVGVEGHDGLLSRILFESGPPLGCDAMFFNTAQEFRSDLADRLGCHLKADGAVETDSRQRTCVPGVCLAGDADKDVQFVIVAAGEGATAAVVINKELQEEDRGERDPRQPVVGSGPA